MRQHQKDRLANHYKIEDMMIKQQVPIIREQAGYNLGPELRDPRLNEDFLAQIKNKIDGEKFWVSYITENTALQAVRWDLFEDAMLVFLQERVIFETHNDLTKVNWKLFFTILFQILAHNENEIQSNNPQYPIPCVVLYEDGTIYQGQRENGRRHGKGKLTLSERRGIYDGEFHKGKRQGYGVQTSHNIIIPTNDPIGKRKKEKHSSENSHLKQRNHNPNEENLEVQFSTNSDSEEVEQVTEVPKMIYKGDWKDDMRHGFGIQQFYDGSKYEGQWENNIQTFGSFLWPDGSEYVGEFSGCIINGTGTLKLENEILKGTWRNGQLHGHDCERKLATGEYYKCQNWIEGKMQGFGEHLMPGIELFQGHFRDNKENGNGRKISYIDGYTFDGHFLDGLFHGNGKQQFKNGDIFIGEFHNGFRHGKGKFIFANGDIYEGDWRNDLQNGNGILKLKYNSEFGILDAKYEGEFKDGLYHGKGFFEVKDFQTYEGEYKKGMREGYGKLVQTVDDTKRDYFKQQCLEVYEGYFKQNKYNGMGKLIYSDGVIYEGMWKLGKKDGKGTMTKGDQKFTSLFCEDLVVGPDWNELINDQKMVNLKLNEGMFKMGEWKNRPKDKKGIELVSDNLQRMEKKIN
eukprot:403352421